jgi:hypothetical protein
MESQDRRRDGEGVVMWLLFVYVIGTSHPGLVVQLPSQKACEIAKANILVNQTRGYSVMCISTEKVQ